RHHRLLGPAPACGPVLRHVRQWGIGFRRFHVLSGFRRVAHRRHEWDAGYRARLYWLAVVLAWGAAGYPVAVRGDGLDGLHKPFWARPRKLARATRRHSKRADV